MTRVSGTASTNHDLVRLGQAVRVRRQELAMSQETLADVAGVDRSHMGKIERGERNVTFLNILKIAKALECRASELLIDANL
ncbi:helix-turn-helix transcriptional regulator [Stenotrophomonas sp.]|uniref:helix-turn-helix transcriptional regulator n=1 Tax=Stenotrophomonas sp. TaxID=69392 RepID=UPI0028B08F71|nr:helix-turn-helix transcriptional regulator [Stenotrophomonas sp.]